jgi:cyanophycinase-like exopeptidase
MKNRPKPVLLIAGGRGAERPRGPDPLIRTALGQSDSSNPRIAYVGAASGDNAVFKAFIGKMLLKAGASKVTLAPLCGKRGDPDKARRVIEEADLVFISGGDVDAGMRVLQESGIDPVLKALYADGKPFFGISAGSIMLATQWIRWRDPQNDASAEIFPCLGIASVVCDTHGEGDGWEELRAIQALMPAGSVSYGIVSGSALLVHPDGTVEALGKEIHRFTRRGRKVVQLGNLKLSGRT